MTKRTSLVLAGIGVLATCLVVWFVAAIVLSVSAENDQKALMQDFVEQVSIGDDQAVVERLLAAESEITRGGAYLLDDNIPEGPGIDRWTVTTPTNLDAACHADVVFEDEKVVYIVEPWCTS
jgi:hypothetical protein